MRHGPGMEQTTRPGVSYAMFAAAVTLGGSNFLAVRLSNRELDPFWGAGLRFSLAASIFVLIVLALRLPWPRGQAAHPHDRQRVAWHLHLLRAHVLGFGTGHGRDGHDRPSPGPAGDLAPCVGATTRTTQREGGRRVAPGCRRDHVDGDRARPGDALVHSPARSLGSDGVRRGKASSSPR